VHNMRLRSERNVSGNVVNRQVVLPFKTSLVIAFNSIRVRFFRSAVTTLSLVLAVAFLSFVRIDIDMADGLLSAGDPEYRETLARAGYDVSPDTDGAGSSPKQRWLVILSLLVCTVGIVNAQLMAVTERFREIGTMKCLGALDRFVLRLFLLEAALQGGIGGILGALIGAGFSMVGGLMKFGPVAVFQLSWLSVIESLAVSVCIGFGLSLLGVLYPAMVAARMRPVDAMRVEQ